MKQNELHVVTGAFGYSGKYIAQRLLEQGHRVRTITSKQPVLDPFQGQVEHHPLAFDNHNQLVASLRGASVLYNTYWVRFNHANFKHIEAVDNTIRLFKAAKEAGVQRVVHVSITNPSEESTLEYFHGKAVLERALRESGMSYAILRPTVLFGKEDILINNIAWALRKLPVVGVFGDGSYRLQPIYVDDLAQLAVEQGAATESRTINAIGPETFSYRELVATIGSIIGKHRPIISVSPNLGYLACSVIGKLVGDVFITREEIEGLMADLLYVDAPPTGSTRLTDWARKHAATLGAAYASELGRRR
ncbi:NADH dehydrogenase [Trichlorobacter thiogenes]|uniref:NADH dehydrogenase n=1 Tax=Trichlorobacter thiogenes TaxID=115783 RepID=A0A1T4KAS0_9BACT|nr:NAD-dependent epimerase/dehydratase family protein [Trichlorobacter thiogenes]SJZ39511.1 NADH dehydrogenase [Trichlorobacter thiogenes]